MKQTAVEWLKSQIELRTDGYFGFPWAEIFEKAKAMEKEQMLGFYLDRIYVHKELREEFEQYYNETYKK
jgi:hypothetical protein